MSRTVPGQVESLVPLREVVLEHVKTSGEH
jgi:hypothetical protein